MINDEFEKEDNQLENSDIFEDLEESEQDSDDSLTKTKDLEDLVLNEIDDPVADEEGDGE